MKYELLLAGLFALSMANIVPNIVQKRDDSYDVNKKLGEIKANIAEDRDYLIPKDETENATKDEDDQDAINEDEIDDNNEFIKAAEEKIANGKRAVRNSIPYQVLLTTFDLNDVNYTCGGALISTSHVLTAAHCLYGRVQVAVHLGAHNRLNPGESGRVTQVITDRTKLMMHESFVIDVSADTKFDIGIIILIDPVRLNSKIQIIPLASCSTSPSTYAGDPAKVSGWGNYRNDDQPKYLRVVKEDIMRNRDCRDKFPEVDDTRFCLDGRRRRGSCPGDSGGPVTVKRSNGRHLLGLVSYGARSCYTGSPTVHTFVPSYCTWISSKTGLKLS